MAGRDAIETLFKALGYKVHFVDCTPLQEAHVNKVLETREIEKCMHCHNFVHEVFSNNGWCELLMRRLDNWLSIPTDCPLPKADK